MKAYKYETFEEIALDLRRLSLERQIAWEELKVLKSNAKEELQPLNWLQTGLKILSKFSFILMLKKLFKL